MAVLASVNLLPVTLMPSCRLDGHQTTSFWSVSSLCGPCRFSPPLPTFSHLPRGRRRVPVSFTLVYAQDISRELQCTLVIVRLCTLFVLSYPLLLDVFCDNKVMLLRCSSFPFFNHGLSCCALSLFVLM